MANVANEEMAIVGLIIAGILYVVTVSLIIVGMVRVSRSRILTTGAQSFLFATLGLALLVIFGCPVAGLIVPIGL